MFAKWIWAVGMVANFAVALVSSGDMTAHMGCAIACMAMWRIERGERW